MFTAETYDSKKDCKATKFWKYLKGGPFPFINQLCISMYVKR